MFRVTIVAVIKLSLLPFGIHDKLNQYVEHLYVLFIFVLSSTVGFCQFKNYSSLDSAIFVMDNTVYIGAMIYVINNFWISRRQKTLFVRIIRRVERDMNNERFVALAASILKRYFLNVGILFASLFTFMISLPIVAAFTGIPLGSTATLLFPCWFPWHVDTFASYVATLTLQFCAAGILYSFSICCVVFVTCFMVILQTHCELFEIESRRLRGGQNRISQVTVPSNRRRTINVSDVAMRAHLEYMILHHRYVQSLIKDIVQCCRYYAANSFVIFIDATVLLSAMLLQESANTTYRMKILSTELFACLQFGLYCYIGEVIISTNTFFPDTIYNTAWYDRPIEQKKLVAIFMTTTHHSYKLSAFNMWTMRLSFLTYMSKTCFSMFQLVYKMQH